MPDWLTEAKFRNEIQPELCQIPVSAISSALGVSKPYASDIRAGKRSPHPRHWQALADLIGVTQTDAATIFENGRP
jgi:hypothetical protein